MTRPPSPKSVIDRHALLHGIFAYAAAPSRRIVDTNPCIGTELPKKRKTPPKALNRNEYAALAVALRQISPDAADLADFLVGSGFRWSEATALTTFDIDDWGGKYLSVSVTHVGRRNAAGQIVDVEDVKGAGSARIAKVDADLTAMIRRRLEWVQPGGLMFTTHTGRRWHYSNFTDRCWYPAIKAANLGRRPTVHWLRHTAVLWGSQGGANLAELSSRIGHRDISTTIGVYGTSITDVGDDVLDRMAAMRGQGRGPAGGIAGPQPG